MPTTSAIVIFRLPLIEGRPVPKTLAVRAGDYITERRQWVSVPEQIGQVDGWHYDYPQMQIVLRVGIEIA